MPTTQVQTRQIADGAINDAKVAAGAAIVSTKLADGANFIKRDGTVAMTGTLNMGSQLISSLSTPSASGDAATKGYVDTQIGALNSLFDAKPSAKAASTGNITVSNPGTAIFDGITLSANDILYLRAQTAPAEQGLYTFNGSAAALTRISQMDAWTEIPGSLFAVEQGTVYADTLWLVTADSGGTLGTTAVTATQINLSGLQAGNFVDKETPSGTINGSNTSFVLANTPTATTEHIYLNGILQDVGAGNDYTISGATITMLTAPLTGEKIRVTYRK